MNTQNQHTVILKSERRIDKNNWKTAWHEYYPGMTSHGHLTGFNLDTMAGNTGFPMHGHRDMEIVTIPTGGKQTHEDSMGNRTELESGDVQVMSAGSGIEHSEMNRESEPFKSYQIWVYPNKKGLTPSYTQRTFEPTFDEWQLLVSPNGSDNSLRINQNAWFFKLVSKSGIQNTYQNRLPNSAVYVQCISGSCTIDGLTLKEEDSIEVIANSQIIVSLNSESQLLLIETPQLASS